MSFSNEGFVPLGDLVDMCRERGHPVEVLAFDSKRYVGALIGIHGPTGAKVGNVSHTRNTEYVLLSGDADRIGRMAEQVLHRTQPAGDAAATSR